MRLILATVTAAALLTSSTFAVSATELAAGKPAGIKQAQSNTSTLVLIGLGAGLTGLAIAAIASSGKAGGPNSSSNTVTGTAP
jgi:hypothetical protein